MANLCASRRSPVASTAGVVSLLGILLLILAGFPQGTSADGLVESERLEEYYKRNYTWPVSTYVPNTEGWRQLYESRFAQCAEIEGRYRVVCLLPFFFLLLSLFTYPRALVPFLDRGDR